MKATKIAALIVAGTLLAAGGAAGGIAATGGSNPAPKPAIVKVVPTPTPTPYEAPPVLPAPPVKKTPKPTPKPTQPTVPVKPKPVSPTPTGPVNLGSAGDAKFFAPGNPGEKTVALTFDDGPGPSTAAIMAILSKDGIPATFFNLGGQMVKYPNTTRAEAKSGTFTIGNHSWDHARMLGMSKADQQMEMMKTIDEQIRLTGTRPALFRPPFGDYDHNTELEVRETGMSTIYNWTVDSEDWKYSTASAKNVETIVKLVESETLKWTHPIILMHNNSVGNPNTVAALPIIIKFLQANGYKFVELS